jgi:hypothetical protein
LYLKRAHLVPSSATVDVPYFQRGEVMKMVVAVFREGKFLATPCTEQQKDKEKRIQAKTKIKIKTKMRVKTKIKINTHRETRAKTNARQRLCQKKIQYPDGRLLGCLRSWSWSWSWRLRQGQRQRQTTKDKDKRLRYRQR